MYIYIIYTGREGVENGKKKLCCFL